MTDAEVLAGALIDHRCDRKYMDEAAWGIPCASVPDVHAIHAAMIEKPGKLGSHVGTLRAWDCAHQPTSLRIRFTHASSLTCSSACARLESRHDQCGGMDLIQPG